MIAHADVLESKVVATLGSFMSPMNARTLYQRAARAANGDGDAADVSGIVGRMRAGIRLFVRPQDVARAEAALAALSTPSATPSSFSIELRAESDVHAARCAARDACLALGTRSLTTQKILTVVSELARNVVMYTPGGRIEIVPRSAPPASLTIVCEDRGAGIPHLEDVLAGRYRSRTGLGKGIAGVKKLMDTFEIDSGVTGTRIVATASLSIGGPS